MAGKGDVLRPWYGTYMGQCTRFLYLSHRRAAKAQASAQTRLSLRCSHAQSMDVDEDSEAKVQTSRFTGHVSMDVY